MKMGSATKRRIRFALIGIAATGLGALAAVAVASKPTASAGVGRGFSGDSNATATYQWTGFRGAHEAGLTVTNFGRTTTTTTTAGASGQIIQDRIPVTCGDVLSASGAVRNAGGKALPLSAATSATTTIPADDASCAGQSP